MSAQTAEKIYREVRALREETKSLKKLIFLMLRDGEGEYKDSFVKKALRQSHSAPQFIFKNKGEFLKHLSAG